MISESCLWCLDWYWEGLRLKKLVTNSWVHVYPDLISRGGGGGCVLWVYVKLVMGF